MTIRIKPIRRPQLTQRQVRSLAYRAADRICGVQSQQPRSFGKKKAA